MVGGGKIAARRARVLACFGCRVQVIAPKLSEKMEQLLQGGEQDAQLQWICRSWQPGDCTGQGYLPDLALAATDDPAVNTAFVEECHRAGVPVNRCDCHECFSNILKAFIVKVSDFLHKVINLFQ